MVMRGGRGGGRDHGSREAPEGTKGDRAAGEKNAARLGIDPFQLFCAYHLGITEDNGYRHQNVHVVARRFKTSPGVIKQLLVDLEMDPESLVQSGFDIA